ncbi:MAG TPA: long-chain fatty acid--CoA ligase [Pseudonocardia sp.]|uniref:long-chain-fatty-acid--CoA ligase n=1 Tax=Pseudonocardia sp. TaxID=60912 RepID=UPI002BE143CA|nr:long-chain fatty acid--CoA ligase [Pseudonocardia sp.]HTF53864.1 long-chain fatty acid--CoA ligase [Pseudonocardia sp.]
MNLAANLLRTAQAHPERVALKLDDAEVTYAQLDLASRAVAGLLAERGVQPGDRVGIMLPNVPHWAVLYYGVLRAGAVAVPMNPLLKEREVAYYLSDSGAKLMFVWHGFAAEAEAAAKLTDAEAISVDPTGFLSLLAEATPVPGLVERDDQDTAVILYTSGTTGQPKGAELTNGNLLRNVEVSAFDLVHANEDDVVFGGLPLFHVFGQTCGLNTAVATAATLTLLPRFDPTKALEVLVRDKVTIFQGVPTMYVALVNHPERASFDLSNLRICVSGGAAMPVEVMTAFEKEFGCVVLEGYGLSETSPAASFNLPDKRKPGSIGTPINGVEFRVVDELGNELPIDEVGEIAIRGHNVMKGYWNKPEQTAAAIKGGWFHTGDLGRKDADGFYYIVDRKKDMIIRGGYNVYPREIEEVLYEHPAVAEVAVVGVPHAELGEEVAAAVAIKPGSTATAEELREFVKGQVAAYKYPRIVRILDSLPKGPTGKILKRDIDLTDLAST